MILSFPREIVLSETLGLELWNEIEERNIVQAQGIANLGYALTGRSVKTSDAVDELLAANEDGNNTLNCNEFLNLSCDKYLNKVNIKEWGNVHSIYGELASRLRRKKLTSLEPHSNLLLARETRDGIDQMCSSLIMNDIYETEIMASLKKEYNIDNCANEFERKNLYQKLSYECNKYCINWGTGDSKHWDYTFGNELLHHLAKLKVMEKNGTLSVF